MKGRNRFTRDEAAQIKQILRDKIASGNKKHFRDQLRALGFYISDYLYVPTGFAVEDFDRCVAQGLITIMPLTTTTEGIP